MPEKINVSTILPVQPERLYKAWLDSKEHSAFTRNQAKIEPKIGGKFEAWDGYISGTTTQLDENKRIVQNWRTTDFPSKSPDSILEITLEAVKGGTKITLNHTNIPEGQGEDYKEGWLDYYFKPMKEYFKK